MVEKYGGLGDDVLYGGSTEDIVWGRDGDDTLFGYGSDDLLIDDQGNRTVIDASWGNDTIAIGSTQFASGSISGGSGTDVLRMMNADISNLALDRVEVLMVAGTVTAQAQQLAGFQTIQRVAGDLTSFVRLRLAASAPFALNLEPALSAGGMVRAVTLTGSTGADSVLAGGGADTLAGLAGNDSLGGGNGGDRLFGGEGDDWLEGGSGDDSLEGEEGEDQLFGGSGNDSLTDTEGTLALWGGGGDDLLSFGLRSASGVISGGTGRDRLLAGAGDLSGLTLQEIEVLELAFGVTGRAAQFDGFAEIRMTGGGRVVLALAPTGGPVTLDLSDELGGSGPRAAVLTGSSDDETLTLGLADDLVFAAGGHDLVNGGAGNDSLTGGLGNDTLRGGVGDDTLQGEAGADWLAGGAGNDWLRDTDGWADLSGGDGEDELVVSGLAGGQLDGGAGLDRLTNASAGVGLDLSGLTIANIEVLETGGAWVRLSARQLAGFATIRNAGGTVLLQLATGDVVVDLTRATFDGTRAWASVVTGTTAADTITGGIGNDTISAGNGDDLISGGLGRNALSGGNGVNTLTYAGFDRAVTAALIWGRADWSEGGDILSGFQTVIGSGFDDHLTGDLVGNQLLGGAGHDTLMGLEGADTLTGGSGDDRIEGGFGADLLLFDTGFGRDTLVGITLDDRIDLSGFDLYFEELVLTQEGTDTIVTLPGAAGVLVFTGHAPGDILAGYFDFGTHPGRSFTGTALDDLARADPAALSGFTGAVAFALADGAGDRFEAGAGRDTILAGPGDDLIYGGADDDSLSGGAGHDTLIGGAGNDTLVVAGGDSVDGGADTDLADFSAAAGAIVIDLLSGSFAGASGVTALLGIENLRGSGFDDSLTGDNGASVLEGGLGADTLRGNGGNDALDGGGGADLLDGGVGNDVLVVEDAGDQALGGAGIDLVLSAVSFTLGSDVEHLTLTGSAAIDGTGNAGSNTLTGNAGDNILTGGRGHDTYVVQNSGDQVVELGAEGSDTVQAWVHWQLQEEVEALVLLGLSDLSGWGNGLANAITGNAGANVIHGGGRSDTLTGGAGADVFVFDGTKGEDVITDFSTEDRIDISAVTLGSATPGIVAQAGADVRITLDANSTVLVLGALVADVETALLW